MIGYINILEIQPESKNIQEAKVFLNSNNIF